MGAHIRNLRLQMIQAHHHRLFELLDEVRVMVLDPILDYVLGRL